MKKALLASAVAFACMFSAMPQANAASSTGSNGGYYWGLYYTGGSASVSFPSSGSISCSWGSGITDCGFGKGWKPSSVRTVSYKINSANNVHSVGLYGWTQSPTIEYYIDDIGSPSLTSSGTVFSDGYNYNCYKYQRVNAPSPFGTQTFWQYKDGRKYTQASAGQSLTITMANHVNHWKSAGGQGWGTVYDTLVEEEAFSGPGNGQVTIQ